MVCRRGNVAGVVLRVIFRYSDGSDLGEAAAVAASADVAVVVVAAFSTEGVDRTNLNFGAQDDLVYAVAQSQPNTVVVMVHPGSLSRLFFV